MSDGAREEWAFAHAWIQAMDWPSAHAASWLRSNRSKLRAGLDAVAITQTATREPKKLKRRLAAMRRAIDKLEEIL